MPPTRTPRSGTQGPAEHDADETSWIALAREGDLSAFEKLYRRHVGRVHGLCRRMVSDRQLAEDLTQEAFVQAWRKLGSFDGRSELSTWLHRLTVNLVWSRLRRTLRRRELAEDELWEDGPAAPVAGTDLPDGGGDRATATSATTTRASPIARLDLERAIATLPARARMVFVLYELYGLTHPEISEQLEISVGASKAQLHRARQLLRGRLA